MPLLQNNTPHLHLRMGTHLVAHALWCLFNSSTKKSRSDPMLAWKIAAPSQMCSKPTCAVSGCICVNGIKMSLLLAAMSFG